MSSRLALLVLALLPNSLGAQSLARRVANVRDGTVRLTYAARPGICGDGRETVRTGDRFFVLPSTYGNGRGEHDYCIAGPIRVAIGRRDGESVSYRVHVGGGWSADDNVTDLGPVSAPEAAQYLLDAATSAHGDNSRYALAAAVFADSAELALDLAAIARDHNIGRDVRQNAVFWIGSYEDNEAIRALHDLAGDGSLDEEVRGAAFIAFGRDNISDDDIAWLRRLYPSLSDKLRSNVFLAVSQSGSPRASSWLAEVAASPEETEHNREQAMFWLGQGRGPSSDLVRLYDRLDGTQLRSHLTFVLSQRHDGESLDKLIDIAEHDHDRDVRRQALFWLGQSKDPRALAYIRDLVTR
jgi:HEAT repeat protein